MTIPEFAKLAGRTPQAIYGRLKERKIKLSDLQEEDGKTLSQSGLSILSSLFKVTETELRLYSEKKQDKIELEQNKAEQDKERLLLSQKIEQLKQDNEELRTQLAELRGKVKEKDERIADMKARVEFTERIILQRLPAPAPRPSLWERITGRGKRQETPSTESK